MAIRINDYDDFDDFEEYDDTITQDTDYIEDQLTSDSRIDDDEIEVDPIIQELLRSRGIKDTSKIKFENEDGELEEHHWNSLSQEDKLGILQSDSVYNPEEGLDDSEIELINTIRSSKMTPSEYLNYIQKTSVDQFVKNQTLDQSHYNIDDIDDNTLYVMDIIARSGNDAFSDEELRNMLETAQSNPELFQKQINAIRNEYKQRENSDRSQLMQVQQQKQIEQYNQFAESVENEIRNLNEFAGYDIDMSEDEMKDVYDFITGFDAAGVSILGKALNDPKTLAKIGWWLLYGENAIEDINNYWINEIKQISKVKREKKVEIKPKQNTKKSDSFIDFDDEF